MAIIRRLVNVAQERVRRAEWRTRLGVLAAHLLPRPLVLLPEAAPLLEVLKQRGNVMLPDLFDCERLLALRALLETKVCYDPWLPELGDFHIGDAPQQTNNARIRGVSDLREARAIANQPLVLQIVSNYLGCKPTIDDILAWWSIPGRPLPKEEQFFHRDNDAIRFVKLFVYLSEVRKDDGAHFYVVGSHRDNTFLQRRRRFTDEVIATKYDESRIEPMVGQLGTTFLEDTFGLHKGTVPTTRSRLVFQVRYTNYPSSFARRESVRAAGDLDPYVNRLVMPLNRDAGDNRRNSTADANARVFAD